MTEQRGLLVLIGLQVVVVALLVVLLLQRGESARTIPASTLYQAVLPNDGQAYFGKIESQEPHQLVLTDVYYVQSRVNQETKEVSNILVKRGQEWHGPDRMTLNRDHVMLIEPVGSQSAVAKLIEDSRKAPAQQSPASG